MPPENVTARAITPGLGKPRIPAYPLPGCPGPRPRQCPNAADNADDHRFDDKLHTDAAIGGAQSFSGANLTGALGDGNQHDVHHTDAAYHQADSGDDRNCQQW